MKKNSGSVYAYLGLGANLGDRLSALYAACHHLATIGGVTDLVCSRVFETDAVTPDPQPRFLNAVVRITTVLDPLTLLHAGLSIERALGRTRPPGRRHAPRPIDVDLLLYGDRIIQQPGLQIPHPGLLERAFVRIPLADVAQKGLLHPVTATPLDRPLRHPGICVFATPPIVRSQFLQ